MNSEEEKEVVYRCEIHRPSVAYQTCSHCRHRSYCPDCKQCWRTKSGFCNNKPKED